METIDNLTDEQKIDGILFTIQETIGLVDTDKMDRMIDSIKDLLEKEKVNLVEFFLIMGELLDIDSSGYLNDNVIIEAFTKYFKNISKIKRAFD